MRFLPMLLALLCGPLAAQTCTTTISAGASISSAVSSVANGGTVCLNAGAYPAWNATVTKTSQTTVTSAPGVTASQVTVPSFNFQSSRYITVTRITIGPNNTYLGTSRVGGTAARNIHLRKNVFTGPLSIWTPQNINQDTVVDGNYFGNVVQSVNEGRLGVQGSDANSVTNGVVISNNVFEGPGPSDGIQITGSGYGTVIGPGNVFTGIKQNPVCTAAGDVHCDPIQTYGGSNTTITGNYFYGNSTGMMLNGADGPVTVTENVFVTDGEYPDQIVRAGTTGDVFTNNTFANGARMRFGDSLGTVSGALVRNNIITGGFSFQYGQTQAGLGTIDHNLIPGSAIGTGGISGSPTFVGGASPTIWPGYTLTSGSLGALTGSDGKNMGANFFGIGTVGSPSLPPSNLRIN